MKDAEGCKLSTYLSLEHFRYLQVSEFFKVKSDARTLLEALRFQLQLDGCRHEVTIASSVSTWERSCVCFADAGLKVSGVSERSLSGCEPARWGHARLLSWTTCQGGECWQG